MTDYLELYNTVGASQFSDLICKTAPYFSTIDPEFIHFGLERVEICLRNQKKVHNHLGTIHAIAICNAAELAAGLQTDICIPDGARWIPKGMTVSYLAKAKTDLRIITNIENLDFSKEGDIVVRVDCFDDDTVNVARCDITMNIKMG